MVRWISIIFAILAMVSVGGCGAKDDHAASDGAKGMPGALGTFAFKPKDWADGQTTWWKDSDGIDPGVAGCHIGTDKDGNANGRMFG